MIEHLQCLLSEIHRMPPCGRKVHEKHNVLFLINSAIELGEEGRMRLAYARGLDFVCKSSTMGRE